MTFGVQSTSQYGTVYMFEYDRENRTRVSHGRNSSIVICGASLPYDGNLASDRFSGSQGIYSESSFLNSSGSSFIQASQSPTAELTYENPCHCSKPYLVRVDLNICPKRKYILRLASEGHHSFRLIL